jgi:hypothetical protein
MTLILDYAWAKPTPAAIKAAGYSGVMRYLSPDSTKNLSKPEATALLAAGLSIGLIWESTANRAGQGFAAGAADAATAEAQATALGYPFSAALFYAVDFDGGVAAVAPYFAGVASRAARPVGVYGSARVVEGVAVLWKWQACAWSAGRVSASAHLYQRLRATVPNPLPSTDENIILHPFPMWTTPAPVSRGWVRTVIDAVKAFLFPRPAYPGYVTSVKSHGDYVTRMIQTRLRALNYPVVVDGIFGNETARWTGLFQSRHGLRADGVVGPATWKALWA